MQFFQISSRPAHLHAKTSPSVAELIHFLISMLMESYLSFQSPVSPFPQGTCVLSVLSARSAFSENCHQLCTPFPRNATLRLRTVHRRQQEHRGSSPSPTLFSKGLQLHLRWLHILRLQFRAGGLKFHTKPVPMHSPLLRESL